MSTTFQAKKSSQAKVGVITVNWNDYENTARLLHSLRRIDHPDFTVTVVDNGSVDGSRELLREDFPEISLLEMGHNAGFGAANNAALKMLLEKNVNFSLLLNNDTIPKQEALAKLLNVMESSPQTGAVGAIILEDSPKHIIQSYGGARILTWLGIAKPAKSANDPVEFLTGACILFRNQALREVGLFDEKFFLYWEDADLCLRLSNAGWELKVADAHIIHTGSVATNRHPRKRSMHIMRSYSLFMRKHAKFPKLKTLTATLFQSIGKILRGNLPAAYGCWEGWYSGQNTKQKHYV